MKTAKQAPLKIHKNIPIPEKGSGKEARKRRPPKYQFGKMEIGDSFFDEARDTKHANQVRSTIFTCLKGHNDRHNQKIKITTRYVETKHTIGVWRIK